MANQPSPLLPRQPEQQPESLDQGTHEGIPSQDLNLHQEQPSHVETQDTASADVVREKIISEAAGLSSQSSQPQQGDEPQTTPVATLSAKGLSDLSPEDQVNHLVDMAHKNGLDHAYKLANATNNAYVIDRFHDELVNRVLHNKQQSM